VDPKDPCVFCKIIRKDIPATVVREAGDWIVLKDRNPQAPVHVLIIPKKHIPSLADATPADRPLLSEVMLEAARVARELNIEATGWRLVANANADGGQTVPHLHLHVLGGRRMSWPPG
jgi:histidine triad (HIT) family protein